MAEQLFHEGLLEEGCRVSVGDLGRRKLILSPRCTDPLHKHKHRL